MYAAKFCTVVYSGKLVSSIADTHFNSVNTSTCSGKSMDDSRPIASGTVTLPPQ